MLKLSAAAERRHMPWRLSNVSGALGDPLEVRNIAIAWAPLDLQIY